jgi:hypothetical protein
MQCTPFPKVLSLTLLRLTKYWKSWYTRLCHQRQNQTFGGLTVKKSVLVLATIAFAGVAHATITYEVDASFTGSGFTTAGVSTALTVGGETLTFTFTPSEPATPVASGTNTAWGSLFLSLSGNNSSRSFDLSTITLTLQLVDLATGGFVTEVGTFSGTASNTGTSLTGSTGVITWSPQGTQSVGGLSTTTFTTDNSDPVGALLAPTASTTVNGTVATVSTTPEPATFGLMGAALLGLGALARKRKA